MNKLAQFFHELVNPHCPECKKEREQIRLEEFQREELERERLENDRVCQSCENLNRQLAVTNEIINKLVSPKNVEPLTEQAPPVITPQRNLPWHVKRQMMEAEDREKAKALRNAAKADTELRTEPVTNATPIRPLTVDEMEQEIANAEPNSPAI